MASTALILVDIQNDYFKGGAWPVELMDKVAGNARRLLEHSRRTGDTIIHVRHEMADATAPFFRPGTEGAQIHQFVAPLESELVILKHRPNSFQGTSLRDELEKRGVGQVTICGAMSHMCIDATARAAADFGFGVTIIADACGARELSFDGEVVPASQVQRAFMAPLAASYGRVITCDDYL
ncbi:MAG: cysteine hydrolase family protein [Hyphomicrobiales bacterium]